MKDFNFNKLGVLKDHVMWTVEYMGVVYRFDSYIPDDIDTKHFIKEHIEELELYAKYEKANVWNIDSKNGRMEWKIAQDLDDLFTENDIDVFGFWDKETE